MASVLAFPSLLACGSTNSRSCCTLSLNPAVEHIAMAFAGLERWYALHTRHVSTISGIEKEALGGATAALGSLYMCSALAWGLRRYGIRGVRFTTVGLMDLNTCDARPRSETDQLGSVSACASEPRRDHRSRGTRSGTLPGRERWSPAASGGGSTASSLFSTLMGMSEPGMPVVA